jgi:hypothetical protein
MLNLLPRVNGEFCRRSFFAGSARLNPHQRNLCRVRIKKKDRNVPLTVPEGAFGCMMIEASHDEIGS